MMSCRRQLAVFANPAAGRGRRALDKALAVLEARGVGYRVHAPQTGEGLRQAIRTLAADVEAIVIAGGDGTINQALPALQGSEAVLGILPLGTANDLARSLGIPDDPDAAARVLVEGERTRMDLGCVNGRVFCNVAHIGLGAARPQRGSRAAGQAPAAFPGVSPERGTGDPAASAVYGGDHGG
ncbi:MAG: diacylglycerol kinase family protein [Arhodomonas sp.]|nr:diacylglycerol kinase family protein [Arhodomonas sp.]